MKKVQTKYGLMPKWVKIMLLEIKNPETMPDRLSGWKKALFHYTLFQTNLLSIRLPTDNANANANVLNLNNLSLDFGGRKDIKKDARIILASNPNLSVKDLMDLLRLSLIMQCEAEVGKAVLGNPVLPLLILENPNLGLELPYMAQTIINLDRQDPLCQDAPFTTEELKIIQDLVRNGLVNPA